MHVDNYAGDCLYPSEKRTSSRVHNMKEDGSLHQVGWVERSETVIPRLDRGTQCLSRKDAGSRAKNMRGMTQTGMFATTPEVKVRARAKSLGPEIIRRFK